MPFLLPWIGMTSRCSRSFSRSIVVLSLIRTLESNKDSREQLDYVNVFLCVDQEMSVFMSIYYPLHAQPTLKNR